MLSTSPPDQRIRLRNLESTFHLTEEGLGAGPTLTDERPNSYFRQADRHLDRLAMGDDSQDHEHIGLTSPYQDEDILESTRRRASAHPKTPYEANGKQSSFSSGSTHDIQNGNGSHRDQRQKKPELKDETVAEAAGLSGKDTNAFILLVVLCEYLWLYTRSETKETHSIRLHVLFMSHRSVSSCQL